MFNPVYVSMIAFGRPGSTEMLVILVIVLLLFGPKYLPRLGKSIGKTIQGFKSGLDEADDKDKEQIEKKDEEEI